MDNRVDGAQSVDGQVIGSYLHGIFDHNDARQSLLDWAGLSNGKGFDYDALIERNIDRLADCFEEQLDIDAMLSWL